MRRLRPGDHAPDTALYTPDGNIVRTTELWSDTPVVINFFRHFG